MSNIDSIKPSYDSLNALNSSVKAFQDLISLMPEGSEMSSLLSVLCDRFEADSKLVESEIIALWKYVPDIQTQS